MDHAQPLSLGWVLTEHRSGSLRVVGPRAWLAPGLGHPVAWPRAPFCSSRELSEQSGTLSLDLAGFFPAQFLLIPAPTTPDLQKKSLFPSD